MSKIPPRLKLVKSNLRPRLGGVPPPDEMKPDRYIAKCSAAVLDNNFVCTWQWVIHKGKFAGVSMRGWQPIADKCGEVQPFGKFAKFCEIALRRPLGVDDDLENPAEIFANKVFVVCVGYRRTKRPGGGGEASNELAQVKKDDKDFLRIIEIVELVDDD